VTTKFTLWTPQISLRLKYSGLIQMRGPPLKSRGDEMAVEILYDKGLRLKNLGYLMKT